MDSANRLGTDSSVGREVADVGKIEFMNGQYLALDW